MERNGVFIIEADAYDFALEAPPDLMGAFAPKAGVYMMNLPKSGCPGLLIGTLLWLRSSYRSWKWPGANMLMASSVAVEFASISFEAGTST